MASGIARRGSAGIAKGLWEGICSRSAAMVGLGWASAGVGVGKIAPFGARWVSSQILRTRMKSVKSIQKITKAMKMVAASKLRGGQVKAERSRGLWQPFTALLGDNPGVNVKKKLIVTISSDKGLCGGINSTSVKYSRAIMRLNALMGADKEAKYVVIGEKGKAQLQRDARKSINMFIGETQKLSICFTQVSMMADEILKNNPSDAYHVVYNKFNSVVSYLPTVGTILSPETQLGGEGKIGGLDAYEIEGDESQAEALQNLSEFQFAAMMYNAMLENACSESGARMSAMDNSSKNATDMLDRLTLTYNRGRQAKITTELIEIISGAAALSARLILEIGCLYQRLALETDVPLLMCTHCRKVCILLQGLVSFGSPSHVGATWSGKNNKESTIEGTSKHSYHTMAECPSRFSLP